MNTMNTKKLATLAILLAAEIILSRFLSISLPIVKIGFAFVPVVVAALMFGPLYAGLIGALGDFIGAVLFPIGPYFPGFTLTAALTGVVYGLLLFKKPASWARIVCAVVVVLVVNTLVLDTLWLIMLYGNSVAAILPARLIKCAVMLPIEVAVIGALTKQKWLSRAIYST